MRIRQSIAILTTTTVSLLGGIAPAFSHSSAPAQTGFESTQVAVVHAYPEELTQVYVSNCVSTGQSSGMTSEQANTYCRCTINEFQNRYTLEEFMAISARVLQNQTPPELMEVVNTCLPTVTATPQ